MADRALAHPDIAKTSRASGRVRRAHALVRNRVLDESGPPDEAIPETCPYASDDLMTRDIALAPETKA